MKASYRTVLLAVLAVGVLSVAACGTEPAADGGQKTQKQAAGEATETRNESASMASEMVMENGEYSDVRFIDAMIPHHRDAVEMARVALENAQHEELRELSRRIIAAQEEEIGTLRFIREQQAGSPDAPMDMGGEEMGEMEMVDPGQLAREKPFDRAFIDAMIEHHQSAIEMARIAEEQSEVPEIRGLAGDIIEAQTLEIDRMRDWREEWYPEG